ncbi:MAG: LLM class flavin-dependent oxidoreductase [Acidimicrobiia bacterium]|nr:LLM class flavin-dependent oxidoreductase [Acidimicrobiia bacterium]
MRTSLFYLLDHYPELSGSVEDRYVAVLDQCVLAESLGYEAVWLAEHHFHQLGTAPNPAVLLAAIAARTTDLRVGPAVAVLPMRPALYTAENYAMVDNISNGRLNLGVGSGSSPFELAGVGLEPARAKDEYLLSLEELRQRFEGAAAGQLGYETMNLPPVQQPAPPTFIATSSVDGARRLGEEGSSLLTISTPGTRDTSEIGDRVSAHREGLIDAGHDPGSRQAVVVVFGCCATSADEARALGGPALARTTQRMGGPELDSNMLYDKMVDAGTAVLGDPSQAAELIQRFADQGVDRLAFLSGFGALPVDRTADSIRLLAGAASHVMLEPDAGMATPAAGTHPTHAHPRRS